jgi:small glutamine-rich tetratricopeptide repeat-containing protein alpha
MGDAKGSMEAYEKGIEYEGSGGSAAMKKGYETAKRKVEDEGYGGASGEQDPTSPGGGARGMPGQGAGGMPDLSSLAGMFGGGAGRGGGGGMPDLSSIMSNPMFANMAQNVMNNPDMMNNIMSNPRLRQMAEQFGSGGGGAGGGGEGGEGGRGPGGGGGMPDISSLMNDPSIAEM